MLLWLQPERHLEGSKAQQHMSLRLQQLYTYIDRGSILISPNDAVAVATAISRVLRMSRLRGEGTLL